MRKLFNVRVYLLTCLVPLLLLGCSSDKDVVTEVEKSIAPSIHLSLEAVQSRTLDFMVETTDLKKCAWVLQLADEQANVWTDEEIITKGKAVAVNEQSSVEVDELTPNTAYELRVVGRGVDDQLYTQSLVVTTQPSPYAEDHTLIIYMMGNNGLDSFMRENLAKILEGAEEALAHGRIALFFDSTNFTRLTEIVKDENGRVQQKLLKKYYPKQSSVDPQIMADVLETVQKELPAASYGLMMSSHGGGWIPADLFDAYMYEERANPATRFFGQDGDACMEIEDLARVLKQTTFEYLIFDACFMSSIEAVYELREAAQYLIASPCEILSDGFPYAEVLPLLFRSDHGLKEICEVYMNLYEGRSGVITLFDNQQLVPLAESVKQIMRGETTSVDPLTLQAYDGFRIPIYYDLKQYMEALSLDADLINQFNAALNQAILYTAHTAQYYTDYGDKGYKELPQSCGVTCHVPHSKRPQTHEAYLNTPWAKFVGAN